MSILFELKELVIAGVTEQLNLQLQPGMTVSMITSGDQESALLFDTLLGERVPESGFVFFDEQSLHDIARSDLLKMRQSIGTVTARANLISNLKVWENITLPLLYHTGSIPVETSEKILQMLEAADLLRHQWTLPGHLTAAERILTAFIRASVSGPRLLVFAACLDDLPGSQRKKLMQMARDFQAENGAPAALYITTEPLQLPELKPDITIDLRQHPALVTRRS